MQEKEINAIKQDGDKEVAIILTDMVGYSNKTARMNPAQIRDFIISYHRKIRQLICTEENSPIEVEPSAGDGAIVIFEGRPGEGRGEKCRRALSAALQMAFAIQNGQLPDTRIGVYCGDIIEARVGRNLVKFGASFAVAARLETLCEYFKTAILMDRDMARYQDEWQKYLVNVGKVTPKNFTHPVHILTVHAPGLNGSPAMVDEQGLLEFITMKNQAMEYFCGNRLSGIEPDFPLVREKLGEAQKKYLQLTGKRDVATDRILDYIREYPYPDANFFRMGMKIDSAKSDSLGSRLFRLSKQLLKAMNQEFYNALVVDTSWEERFRIEWWKKGDKIIKIGDPADGIFYVDSGEVSTLDSEGKVIATLTAGNIFGEMAYFSREQKRNATVIAESDVVLRRISTEDFASLPTISKIFQRIAEKREEEVRSSCF